MLWSLLLVELCQDYSQELDCLLYSTRTHNNTQSRE